MARYLSTQYTTKTPNNPRNKKGDKNSKKGDDSKSEDKDSTNTGTAGAHVGDVTTPQDSTAPSNGSSIGAHVSETEEPMFWTWSHPMREWFMLIRDILKLNTSGIR